MFVLGNFKRCIPQFTRGRRPAVADIIDKLCDLMCDDPECGCDDCQTLGEACSEISHLRDNEENLLHTLSICNTLLHIEAERADDSN
jgi:hypothetical protein